MLVGGYKERQRENEHVHDAKDLKVIPISLKISTSKGETTVFARGHSQGRDRSVTTWDLSATYTF